MNGVMSIAMNIVKRGKRGFSEMKQMKGIRLETMVSIYLIIAMGLFWSGKLVGSEMMSSIGLVMLLPLIVLVLVMILLLPWCLYQTRKCRIEERNRHE